MDPQSEDSAVTMEVVSIMLAQQYDHIFYRFHQHVMLLEDLFFSAERSVLMLYDVSSKLVAGVVPFSILEAEAAQSRFVKLVKGFEKTSSEELSTFQKETGELRVVLQQIIAKCEQEAAEQERKRQDEFSSLQTVCRREVSAFIATIRAETANSGLEVEAIQTLQAVLSQKIAEIDALRNTLCEMTSTRESERAAHRADLEREREAARSLLHTERSQMDTRLHELMLDAEKMRASHADELAELYGRGNGSMAKLRSDFSTRLLELDSAREALDKAHAENARERKAHQEEKNRLVKLVSDMEVAYESLKLENASIQADAQLQVLGYENFSETRKLIELQQFKKKVAAQATNPSATTSGGGANSPTTRGFSAAADGGFRPSSSSTSSQQLRYNYATASSSAAGARGSSPVSTLTNLVSSPPPYRDSSRSGTTATDRSRSPNGIPLRSPSDTFVRLSTLTGALRDTVASGGNSSSLLTGHDQQQRTASGGSAQQYNSPGMRSTSRSFS